jgi:hypothetical protein
MAVPFICWIMFPIVQRILKNEGGTLTILAKLPDIPNAAMHFTSRLLVALLIAPAFGQVWHNGIPPRFTFHEDKPDLYSVDTGVTLDKTASQEPNGYIEFTNVQLYRDDIRYTFASHRNLSPLITSVKAPLWLRLDMGFLCSSNPSIIRYLSVPLYTSSLFLYAGERAENHGHETSYAVKDLLLVLGCTLTISAVHFTTDPPTDMTAQLETIKAQRDAENATARERQRIVDEQSAAEAKIQMAAAAKQQAKAQAKAAEERARLRAACSFIYDHTSDKKVGDLTVKEAQQVKACQTLNLYPPR